MVLVVFVVVEEILEAEDATVVFTSSNLAFMNPPVSS